jgi:ketosteroid isomerase-like protein
MPRCRDSSAELLALILTAVDGEPLDEEESPACRRTAHRQAGQLLRRFHDAMTGPLVQPEADTVVENTVAGLDKHLAKAGDHLSTTEADLAAAPGGRAARLRTATGRVAARGLLVALTA